MFLWFVLLAIVSTGAIGLHLYLPLYQAEQDITESIEQASWKRRHSPWAYAPAVTVEDFQFGARDEEDPNWRSFTGDLVSKRGEQVGTVKGSFNFEEKWLHSVCEFRPGYSRVKTIIHRQSFKNVD